MDNKINKNVLSGGFPVENLPKPSFPVAQSPRVFPSKKKKVLVWSDSATSTTGFGIVSYHLLKALHSTGEYEIDQLAINFFDKFFDKDKYPYNILPARLDNPRDPYGNQMLIDALQQGDYDLLFVINDTFVVEEVAKNINKIHQVKQQSKRKDFKVIYYYPVDCKLRPEYSTMVEVADAAVAYTEFARRSSAEIGIYPTDVIYHGVDTETFHPIDRDQRLKARRNLLNVDPNEFVIVNVNRNSVRKNLAASIFAFHEFRKVVPNSTLYLHAKMQDGTGTTITDLAIPLKDLGLDPTKDVIFPNNYDAARGFPADTLNILYNCGDMYLTTHRGEGFGLSVIESLACGVPVVAPNNTSMPEILGENEERGLMYPCKETVYIDASGYRPDGRIEDIVNKMRECHQMCLDGSIREKVIAGRQFAEQYTWENVGQEWVALFNRVLTTVISKAAPLIPEGQVL